MGTSQELSLPIQNQGSYPNGNTRTVVQVKEEPARDPFNTAVAQILNDLFVAKDFGEARLVRATGIPRATVRRYLNGERPIRVAELRKIAAAFDEPLADILTKAQRLIE